MISVPRADPRVLGMWLSPQAVHNMHVCFFKASGIMCSALNLFSQENTDPFLKGFLEGLSLGQAWDNLSYIDFKINRLETLVISAKYLHICHTT